MRLVGLLNVLVVGGSSLVCSLGVLELVGCEGGVVEFGELVFLPDGLPLLGDLLGFDLEVLVPLKGAGLSLHQLFNLLSNARDAPFLVVLDLLVVEELLEAEVVPGNPLEGDHVLLLILLLDLAVPRILLLGQFVVFLLDLTVSLPFLGQRLHFFRNFQILFSR